MPIPYRTLFLLDTDTAAIFEIKRLDVQSNNPGDVYFWLYFNKGTQALQPLTFVAMSNDGGVQQREFAQGHLRFTATEGTYTSKEAGVPLLLQPVTPATLPTEVETALFAFFQAAGAAV
ncbi:hypothetical protein J0X19_00220 [Hymenobacter sp. BT186]|uniref:Uncharacterized protein n=1 Tax=Hymenobacter telluris TaxID=2816474 RepID=A0A939ERU3_9BACT|nr:hypothetical protein [Hymenobacter telluris]MBO0356355.1 hypothetical protein [Hymenobacter telluris]MBW3372379.1 hypothetical protein [Hymenobacter norwichensis]